MDHVTDLLLDVSFGRLLIEPSRPLRYIESCLCLKSSDIRKLFSNGVLFFLSFLFSPFFVDKGVPRSAPEVER